MSKLRKLPTSLMTFMSSLFCWFPSLLFVHAAGSCCDVLNELQREEGSGSPFSPPVGYPCAGILFNVQGVCVDPCLPFLARLLF